MPICSRCNLEKSSLDFGSDRRRPSGLKCYCKLCECDISKLRYARLRQDGKLDSIWERQRKTKAALTLRRQAEGRCSECEELRSAEATLCSTHLAIHAEKERRRRARFAQIKRSSPVWGLCKYCGAVDRKSYLAQRICDECRASSRDRQLARQKRWYDELKDTAMMAYGGYRCGCCGETERAFLSLDHINNDGGKHRRELGSGNIFHRLLIWCRRHDYPPVLQVLCMNCNFGKRINGGICPHKAVAAA